MKGIMFEKEKYISEIFPRMASFLTNNVCKNFFKYTSM